MVFSSIVFLFLYLPLVLAVYHLIFLPVTLGYRPQLFRQISTLFLMCASVLFYFWGEANLIWIIIGVTCFDYLAGLLVAGAFHARPIEELEPGGPRTTWQRVAIVGSICCNLAILGFFKYFNFAVDGYNQFVSGLGLSALVVTDVMKVRLPLGISFFTFESMSYTIDVYRGRARATRNFINFGYFVTAFPHLVAGPIIRYRDLAEQIVGRVVTRQHVASGVSRFIIGLGKKVLIANSVAAVADSVFTLPTSQLTPGLAWLGIVCYTLQIYFDFSGYSDMAIGLGRMFGFEFLENFNYPYVSQSVQDFWHRWHISLSNWFRDYLYVPLGGSRCGPRRTYVNLVIVFVLCGLWHGASWTFVAWGLYHGLFLVIERLGFARVLERRARIVRHGYSLAVVIVGWVLFRSETFSQATEFLAALGGVAHGAGTVHCVAAHLSMDVVLAMMAGALLSMPLMPAFIAWRDRLLAAPGVQDRWLTPFYFSAARLAGLSAVLVTSVLSLASGTHNPFIYFRF